MNRTCQNAKNGRLARRELEFMNVVWELGEVTAMQVQETLGKRGCKLRESTVRTILRILEEKEFLKHQVIGRTFVYKARLDRGSVRAAALRDLAGQLFQGSLGEVVRCLAIEVNVAASEKKEIRAALREALKRMS